jgi:FMN phosphatase YigB (HAD superfamily)
VSRIALFDLDNTLIDRQGAFSRWAEWFVGTRSLEADDVQWLLAADRDGHTPRDKLFSQLRARRRLGESTQSLITAYERDYPGFIHPDPDVSEALVRLRAHRWRIAIVTNGLAMQRTKIARAALVDLVDACCISAEVGAWKPDPRIFEHALTVCGGDGGVLDTAWMVGDSAEHDIAGAHAMGLRTVWMHRDRDWVIDSFQPDHRARSVPDAVNILLSAPSSVG